MSSFPNLFRGAGGEKRGGVSVCQVSGQLELMSKGKGSVN